MMTPEDRPRLVTTDRTLRDDLIASLLDSLDTRVSAATHRLAQVTDTVAMLVDANRELNDNLARLCRTVERTLDDLQRRVEKLTRDSYDH